MEAVECGAASLSIILGYYGRIVPLPDLRVACGVSRDGSKASNLIRAAKHYGLAARGFKKELNELKDLAYPYIVFWNFNHFLVVEGYRRGYVYLNDPATGPRRITSEEFDEAYTGVVLVMEPSPEFQRGGRNPAVFPAIWRRLRSSISGIFACTLAALFMVVPTFAAAALTQAFIDNVVVRGMQDWIRPLVIGLLAAVTLKALLLHTQLRILRRLRTKLSISMTTKFLWHLLRLPASYYVQRYSGEVASRTMLNDKLADVLSGRLASTGADVVIGFVYLIVMFRFDVTLTWLAIAFAFVNFAVLRWTSRVRKDQNARLAQDYGKHHAASISGLRGIRTLKASSLESEFFARWAGTYAKVANIRQQFATSSQYLGLLPRFLSSAMSVAILTVGGLSIIDGQMTIGMLVAFQSIALSFLTPVNGLMQLAGQLQELQGDITRLDDVLQNKPDPGIVESTTDEPEVARLEGYVELRNVTFGYDPTAPPLISDLSISIKPGQRVALVGSSGSGKSTIARLICGILQPTTGQILFDGQPRQTIPDTVMANSLACVDQDVVLFGCTVRENLTLWDETIPESQLEKACTDAMIQDVIARLPDGYETQLAEEAANLSGGQRQRLEIARALATGPSILVLDEATSALDAETERLIDDHIRRRKCTCIVVSHRLSTIRDSNEIIVLEGGQVVQRGTHDELLRQDGAYARLLASEGALESVEAAIGE